MIDKSKTQPQTYFHLTGGDAAGITAAASCFSESAEMKTLVVFDFDHTIVDGNSDTWVVRSAPDQILPRWLEDSYEKGRWTEYMSRVLSYIGDQSVHPDSIRSVLGTIPYTDGMQELLSFISQNKKHLDCIVISDANTLFIEWILESASVRSAVDEVFSNPAHIDERGYIHVQHFHSHECARCPVNMCKREVLTEFLESKTNSGVEYQTICYIGDGGNDLCPVRILKPGDFAMPRRGFTLEKLLKRNLKEAPEAQIVPWSSGNEIINQLRALIE